MQPTTAGIADGRGAKTRLIGLQHLDGRTRSSRRARALALSFARAIGGKLTAAQHVAVERAATLTVLAEDSRARRLRGDQTISLEDLTRLDHSAARALQAVLAMRRRKAPAPEADKAAIPTLGELISKDRK